MAEQFVSMADARRVAEGRKKTIDDLKKRIGTLESEISRLRSVLKEHGIDPDNRSILGRPATNEEVAGGKAQWCWTCGNTDCAASKKDVLTMCEKFTKRTKDDMKSDSHFGGNENE